MSRIPEQAKLDFDAMLNNFDGTDIKFTDSDSSNHSLFASILNTEAYTDFINDIKQNYEELTFDNSITPEFINYTDYGYISVEFTDDRINITVNYDTAIEDEDIDVDNKVEESYFPAKSIDAKAQDIADYLGEFMNDPIFLDKTYFDDADTEAMANTFDALNDFVMAYRNSCLNESSNEQANEANSELVKLSNFSKQPKSSRLVTDYIDSEDLHRLMQNPCFGDYTSYQAINGMLVRTDKTRREFPGADGASESRYWKFVKHNNGTWAVYEVDANGVDLGKEPIELTESTKKEYTEDDKKRLIDDLVKCFFTEEEAVKLVDRDIAYAENLAYGNCTAEDFIDAEEWLANN